MPRTAALSTLALALAAGLSTSTLAQSAPAPVSAPITQDPAASSPAASTPATQGALAKALSDDPWWIIQVEPRLWYVGPSGKIKMPVTASGVPSSAAPSDKVRVNDLDVDNTKVRPAGELTLAGGPWRFTFSAADYDGSNESTLNESFRLGPINFASGDRISSKLSFGTYELTAAGRVWNTKFADESAKHDWTEDVQLSVFLLGGVRIYDVEASFARLGSTPSSVEASHAWVEPIIGARAELEFNDDFGAWVQASGGTLPIDDHSSVSFDIAVGFQWRPIKNLSLQLGFRQLGFGLEDGKDLEKFEYTGRLAGLFTGLVIRF